MKLHPYLILIVLAFCSLVACDDDPAAPVDDPGPGIVGQVLDVEGNPAVGAPVGVIFGVPIPWPFEWPPEEFGREVDCFQTRAFTMRFGVEFPSVLTLRIVDHNDRIVRTLAANLELGAGEYELRWNNKDDNGNLAPNGAYMFKATLRRPGFLEETESSLFLLNRPSLDYTDCIGPAVVTDAEGRFRIPYGDLPLGHEIGCGWEETCTIPDSLWIQSAHGIGRVRQALRLDEFENDLEITLHMDHLPD